jgi:hypothetical protein
MKRKNLIMCGTCVAVGIVIGHLLTRTTQFAATNDEVVVHSDTAPTPAKDEDGTDPWPTQGSFAEHDDLPHRDLIPSRSPAVTATVSNVLAKAAKTLAAIKLLSYGFLTADDRTAIEQIDQDAIRELQQSLTPDEFAILEVNRLNEIPFARELKEYIGLSDAELAAIAKYNAAEAELGSAPDREVAQEQNGSALIQKIGEEKFKKFMNFKDPVYRESVTFAQRFGLDPNGVADQITELRKSAMGDLLQINSQLPSEAPENARSSLILKIRERLEHILGHSGAETYLRESKYAYWAQ